MPGPQDRVLKPTPAPDHVPPGQSDISKDGIRPAENDAPREARDEPKADLRERLKRLPPNHPSSPLRDDGSRKAAPSDSNSDQMPLHNEADSPSDSVQDTPFAQPDEPGEAFDPEDDPIIGPNGSWEWKGGHLTFDQSRSGDQAVERCRTAEANLTPAVRGIEAELEHGQLVDETEKYAVKSLNRFKEKLAKLIERHPDEDPDQLAASIHDGVRYTLLFDTESYVEGTGEATRRLQEHGYELRVRKNTWGGSEYKGINTRWFDSENNLLFEVQFHTRESWAAKQRTHDAYAKINDPRTPPTDVEALRAEQCKVSEHVPMPPRWDEISDYRKEP